jgi:hypothetical protein
VDQRLQLVDVIRGVRNRWRLKLAARGAVVVVAGTLLALLLSAGGLESFRFAPGAIIAFRILAIVVFLALVGWAFVRPIRKQVSDAQVAMYLEECDPTLEAAISARSKPARRRTQRIRRGSWKSSSSRRSTSAGRSSAAPRSIAPR